MKFRTRISRITLSALALGAFFSCGPKQPQDPYPQDRVVGIVGYPLASNLDSTWLAQNPDSSGWRLHWTRPSDTTGVAIYIFSGQLPPDQKAKLANGSQPPDLSSRVAKLSASDTSWQIPSALLDGRQGKNLRTDAAAHYYFSIWVQYGSGPIADVPWTELFLGDDIPPQLPFVVDSVGQTTAVLRFARPRDQTSRYDTTFRGPLKMVRALFWPGSTPRDSAGKVRFVEVPPAILKDAAVDSFRLVLDSLNYFTTYCYALKIKDLAGDSVLTDPSSFTTMDQYPPAAPSGLASNFVHSDSAVFTWRAASDTFQSDSSARQAFPNYRIQRYVVRVNGQRVDSAELDPAGVVADIGRFHWSGSVWSWYWRSFRPDKPYTVDLIVYDLSGNMASSVPSVAGIAQPKSTVIPGPCDPGWVGVRQDSSKLSDFCIEEHEHLSGGKIQTRVTWTQAEAICEAAGANLCSEAQWVRACESFPDTSLIATYGAVEAGTGNNGDTLLWLKQYCQVGTGDSVAMLDPTNTDPRCVSGWGVYDMPGRVGEWTRDVYLTDTTGAARQSGTLAYLGASDLTLQADLGTIHGGSALILDQADLTLASSRCGERNYPASSKLDTIPGTTSTRFHPSPNGVSSAWGFRCCRVLP